MIPSSKNAVFPISAYQIVFILQTYRYRQFLLHPLFEMLFIYLFNFI